VELWRSEKATEIAAAMASRRLKKDADLANIDRWEATELQKLRVSVVRLVISFRLMGREFEKDPE
jgi:hypothetical protein